MARTWAPCACWPEGIRDLRACHCALRIQLPDGRTAYTRDGSFERDAQGQLVTADGYLVDPGITIPENASGVTERWTPKGPDHLWYEATIEDPKTFSKPWKISMPLYRRVEPNAQLMQFKCVEFVEEMMYGELRKKPTQAPAPKEQKE